MDRIICENELDELAKLFIGHRVLDRKGITFHQFVALCGQGKLKEAIS